MALKYEVWCEDCEWKPDAIDLIPGVMPAAEYHAVARTHTVNLKVSYVSQTVDPDPEVRT